MAKKRIQTWLALIAVIGVGAVLLFIGGLFAYVSFTAIPLHPDPEKVISVTESSPQAKWAGAAAQGRHLARAGLNGQNLPGLSVAVGVSGEIVWAEGFGWTDLDTRMPVTPRTRFRTGDASKALTSAAVGLLLEKKALKLDDEIQTYVPDFPKKEWP